MAHVIEKHWIPGPCGQIQGLLSVPPHVAACAVVCHPHPQHAGTMNNKVVHRMARTLVEHNVATIRFNFRGVEQSEGSFNDGVGEQDDLLAVSAWIKERTPNNAVLWCGFSFGAFVSLCAAARTKQPDALVCAGLAPRFFTFDPVAKLHTESLWIQGDGDEFGSLQEVQELAIQAAAPPQLVSIPGADHFFTDRLEMLQQALSTFLSQTLSLPKV